MKKIYFVLFCIFCSYTVYSQEYTIFINGTERSYIVHLPSGYDPLQEYPLVFNFHGLTGTSSQQQSYTQMDAVADSEGFIVVYPQGLPNSSGQNSWNVFEDINGPNDLTFVNRMLDTLIRDFSVDEQRVYSTGFSMGGLMSYYLSCNLSDRIAAIAPVSGYMPTTGCNPGNVVPVFHIHGTEDEVVNYIGTWGSAPGSFEYYADHNNCLGQPDSTRLPDANTGDAYTIDFFQYTTCDENSQVWLMRINGGEHVWPGAFGNSIELDASREIWEFFDMFVLDPVPTGVVRNSLYDITVFPNPAVDVLEIHSDQAIRRTIIIDMTGRIMSENQGSSYLDIRHLEAGVYYLIAESVSGKIKQELFVKE